MRLQQFSVPPILIHSLAYILISVLMNIVLQELFRLPQLVTPSLLRLARPIMPFVPILNSAVPITNSPMSATLSFIT
ncbi:hypothetical protein HKD37_12G033923 [Glycine soja]|nr:hypothetical protein GmHk_12G034657 [Glycine max]